MKKYILNLTKEELDIIKMALSRLELEMGHKATLSNSYNNPIVSKAYKQLEERAEKILEKLKEVWQHG